MSDEPSQPRSMDELLADLDTTIKWVGGVEQMVRSEYYAMPSAQRENLAHCLRQVARIRKHLRHLQRDLMGMAQH